MLSTLQQEGVLALPMPWSAEETFSLAAEGQVNDEKLHQGVTGKKAACIRARWGVQLHNRTRG